MTIACLYLVQGTLTGRYDHDPPSLPVAHGEHAEVRKGCSAQDVFGVWAQLKAVEAGHQGLQEQQPAWTRREHRNSAQ